MILETLSSELNCYEQRRAMIKIEDEEQLNVMGSAGRYWRGMRNSVRQNSAAD